MQEKEVFLRERTFFSLYNLPEKGRPAGCSDGEFIRIGKDGSAGIKVDNFTGVKGKSDNMIAGNSCSQHKEIPPCPCKSTGFDISMTAALRKQRRPGI